MFTDEEALRELVHAAVEYLDRRDHDGAAEILAPAMEAVQPRDLIGNELLVHAVVTWARTAVTAAQARQRSKLVELAWLYSTGIDPDSGHPRTLIAGAMVADVKDLYGDHTGALRIRDIVLRGWYAHDDQSGIATAHAELAGTMHQLGRCGDAIRGAATALTGWLPHRTRSAKLTQQLIADLVQMLTMCGRDDEAATTTLEHDDDLPEPGDRARYLLAVPVFARLDWEAYGGGHAKVCARRGPANLAELFPPQALDPWPQRRHRLFTLLAGTDGRQSAAGSWRRAGGHHSRRPPDFDFRHPPQP